MQANLFEAKNQLSTLINAAVAGEKVFIASHGEVQVRLVPCAPSSGLRHWGAWAGRSVAVDEAFSKEADAEVGKLFGRS